MILNIDQDVLKLVRHLGSNEDIQFNRPDVLLFVNMICMVLPVVI
jgi:hypothetical protein